MDYFIVGLSNNNFNFRGITRGSYHVCHQHPTTVANGDVITFYCKPPSPYSRYLIVQQHNDLGCLTIVEIEAYSFTLEGIKIHIFHFKIFFFIYTLLVLLETPKLGGSIWRPFYGYYQTNLEVARKMFQKSYHGCLIECYAMWNCKSVNVLTKESLGIECVFNDDNLSSVIIVKSLWVYYRIV